MPHNRKPNPKNKLFHHVFSGENKEYKIDFVIVYKNEKNEEIETQNNAFRKFLQEKINLKLSTPRQHQNYEYYFVHVPDDILKNYADFLGIKLPVKQYESQTPDKFKFAKVQKPKTNILARVCQYIFSHEENKMEKVNRTVQFRKDYEKLLFNIQDEEFFNESVRIQIVSYILEMGDYQNDNRKHSKHDHNHLSLKKLLAAKIYESAFPMHDTIFPLESKDRVTEEVYRRQELLEEWARMKNWYRLDQPIDKIKDYFGVKVALYFTWVGFYTKMLVVAAVVSIICFVYAIIMLSSDPLSSEICSSDNIVMCPKCDKTCDYWQMKETCIFAKIQHFIDNPAIIFLSVFMSFWSALYLELWKRYSAAIRLHWGIMDYDLESESPRLQYLTRNKLKKSCWKYWKMILTFSVMFFWIFIVLASIFGIIIYKMAAVTFTTFNFDSSKTSYLLPVTSSLISFMCMKLLDVPYKKISLFLTEWECHRTQTDFDNSFAAKVFMFQCVNYFSRLVYIGLVKGNFIGSPNKYNRIFGYRQEECIPAGCLVELTIQIAVVLIGIHISSAIKEYCIPYAIKLYHISKKSEIFDLKESETLADKQFENDFNLPDFPSQNLMSLYLEMILQYGMITVFIAALPISPILALVNNLLETRLNAKKFITLYKRPVPQQVRDIGVWYWILQFIAHISVLSNSLLIACSTHFVPKLVYSLTKNPNHNEHGYLNFTLSVFNTSDFENGTAPISSIYNVTTCRYKDFRKPPGSDEPYTVSLDYWYILAGRLAFVIAYQNFVLFMINFIDWFIPDIPKKVIREQQMIVSEVNRQILENCVSFKHIPRVLIAKEQKRRYLTGKKAVLYYMPITDDVQLVICEFVSQCKNRATNNNNNRKPSMQVSILVYVSIIIINIKYKFFHCLRKKNIFNFIADHAALTLK